MTIKLNSKNPIEKMLATPFFALGLAALSAARPAVMANTTAITAQAAVVKSATNATKIASGSSFTDVAPTVDVNKTMISGLQHRWHNGLD